MCHVPDVTIGLPTHNGAAYLAEALAALLAQDYPSFEVVVSDNASSDATPEIIRSFEAKDQRLRSIRSDTLMTAPQNFNLVFAEGKCRYFMWAADDDLWARSYVRRCVEALEAVPAAVMACTSLRFVDPAGAVRDVDYGRYDNPDLSSASVVDRVRRVLRRGGQYMVYGLARRSALEQTHLFQETYGPDVVLGLELAMLGPIVKIPEALFFYRTFPDRTEQARVARQGGIGDAIAAHRVTSLLESLAATAAASRLPRRVRTRLRAEICWASYVAATPMGLVARRELPARLRTARRVGDGKAVVWFGLLRVAEAIRVLPAAGANLARRMVRAVRRRMRPTT